MEQNFEYNSLPVRTITDENEETWFVGVDICKILEYADINQPLEKLDDDEKKLDRARDGSGQLRKTWIVNESGLYSLILTSIKPEAKAFKRWVTHEVLPSIRKAGKFTVEEEKTRDMQLQDLAKRIDELRSRREDHQKQVNDLKKEIEQRTGEMIALIRMDRSQLMIQFSPS